MISDLRETRSAARRFVTKKLSDGTIYEIREEYIKKTWPFAYQASKLLRIFGTSLAFLGALPLVMTLAVIKGRDFAWDQEIAIILLASILLIVIALVIQIVPEKKLWERAKKELPDDQINRIYFQIYEQHERSQFIALERFCPLVHDEEPQDAKSD